MEKMTKREFVEAVIKMVDGEEVDAMALKVFAAEEIQKMDKALTDRKAKAIEKDAENRALRQKIYEDILKEDEAVTATVVGEMMEISTQKASAQLRKMVSEGMASVEEVKVTKKGVQKGYKKIA